LQKNVVSIKQKLNLNLYRLEQTLLDFELIDLPKNVLNELKKFHEYVYKKTYIDDKFGRDIIDSHGFLVTYYDNSSLKK